MRRLFFTVIILALFGHYLWLLRERHRWETIATHVEHVTPHYYCPMHPSVTSDHPGNCPICGMSLQAAESSEEQVQPSQKKVLFYRHPMGKNVTSRVPMKDEMGMDFIPVYEDEVNTSGSAILDGRTAVLLSEASQQLIGVKKATAVRESVTYEIKASGRVAYDPDLYAAVTEFQVARRASHLTIDSSPVVSSNAQSLVSASKLKLKLMGLSDEQIKALDSNKMNAENLLLPKDAVWVYADLYEYELPYLKVGQEIVSESSLYPEEEFKGKIVSVSPIVNATTRTINVKAQVNDPSHILKPDMFLTVRLKVELGIQLVVPDDAIIHTGDADLVFRVGDSGQFEPKQVKIGLKANRKTVIVAGLSEGEKVVAGANFLVDSESRLRAVLQSVPSQKN